MAYFTEAELESHMLMAFSASTNPTSTQIGLFATEISAMYDGLAAQTEGTETPDEQVKQACLAVATYRVSRIQHGEPIDTPGEINIFKNFMKSTKTQLFYDQQYPTSAGDW